ncbi:MULTISPECIES: hypothetical protein [unclassified Pseudomonas]|uniref:hypothetical protein n=1 Tax=unclassified Pseudomonas TaxID=196821 RepID=UPI000D750FA9|nr:MULTISPECIES: hypothetical protein [unclassified Pseudomonas]
MSFPTIVYRCPGAHHCIGGTYDYIGAADEEALSSLRSAGWFMTLPEAMAGEDIHSKPSRSELEEKASELAIKFDGRTSDRRLTELIEAAIGQES